MGDTETNVPPQLIKEIMIHNFCINSVEEATLEDRTVLKFKAVVLDFKPSHNGWAISEDIAKEYKDTLVNKHIVTRYYSENENDGVDALGDHEQDTATLRNTDGEVEIPITNTRGIGTITKSWIAPLNEGDESSENVLWCEGILFQLDNINECSLLLEWASKDIPILTSVEWYCTKKDLDEDGVSWILDPCFSALTILNSEQRGNKNIVYGNYDCSHIELALNSECYKEFNSAIKEDFDKEKGDTVGEIEEKDNEQVIEQMQNDKSLGDKIYDLSSQLTLMTKNGLGLNIETDYLYVGTWNIYDTYYVFEIRENNDYVYYKVDYTKSDDGSVSIDLDNKKKVVREEIYVEVNQLNEANKTINELQENLKNIEEAKAIVEKELNQIKYDELLENAQENYKNEFIENEAIEKFESEEIQSLIKDTLDSEKCLNAKLELQQVLYQCAKERAPIAKVNNSRDSIFGFESAINLGHSMKCNEKAFNNSGEQIDSSVDKFGLDLDE